MENDFARMMTELRHQKGITQKEAAASLGVSQALLSHYEKGVRECGLNFLIRAAEFYGVSADVLLGLTGREQEKTGKSASGADEGKREIGHSLDVIYDLIARCESRPLTEEVTAFLMLAVYRIFRLIYQNGGETDGTFSISSHTARAMADAAMQVSEAGILCALSGQPAGEIPPVDDRSILKLDSGDFIRIYGDKYHELLRLVKTAENKMVF